MSSAKWRPFCLGLNVLIYQYNDSPHETVQFQLDKADYARGCDTLRLVKIYIHGWGICKGHMS